MRTSYTPALVRFIQVGGIERFEAALLKDLLSYPARNPRAYDSYRLLVLKASHMDIRTSLTTTNRKAWASQVP